MDFLTLANQLIPNYKVLPEHVRAGFERTQAGKELTSSVSQLHNTMHPGLWTQLLHPPIFSETSPEENSERICTDFQANMSSSKEYQELIRKIDLTRVLYKKMLAHHKHAYLKRFQVTLAQLKTTSQRYLSFWDLDEFNANHAVALAKKTPIGQWHDYERALCEHIKKNIGLINGKTPFSEPSLQSKAGVQHSLAKMYSYLCSVRNNQNEVKWCIDAIYKMADAHAFLQGSGLATQNETSRLATFDIINYFRMAGNIAEAKTIFFKFIQPFSPLWIEYSKINKEQNIAQQILRTAMPMLIVSAAIVLVSALLSSLVIPEIAFLFILLPTLYLGLIAASSYVVIKDWVYNNVCQLWSGGPFETAEYQTNNEMIASFGDRETAERVRHFYIHEIKACRKKEKQYQTQIKLCQADKDNRQKNADRELILQFEWYDIHSNPNQSTDEVCDTALNRLQLDGRLACDAIQKELKNEREGDIPTFVHELAEDIKASVECNIRSHGTAKNQIKNTRQLHFFTQPACFKHQAELERAHDQTAALRGEALCR